MSEPIRVAQVLNRMDSGGIEAVVMNYYRHIDRSKLQFDFYFAENSAFPQRVELERLGARVFTLPSYTRIIAYQRALNKAFRDNKYIVVHSHLSSMSVFPLFAAWRSGVPVRICHNHTTSDWGEGIKTLIKYLLRPFNRLFANYWFACGLKTGYWMYGKHAFENGRVYLMPNSIDGDKFVYDPEARAALRRELGINENALVVGHVGRFTYAKNHDYLIGVFDSLHKVDPDALLVLIGEGESEERIRRAVKRKGLESSVIFTGVRNDVNKLYSAMDVFCLPSYYEGFTLVAVEAQISGLVCIRSDNVSGEVDISDNISHLPIGKDDISDWVSQILRVKPNAARSSLPLPDSLSIADSAKTYQNFIGDCYEKALSKS